MEEFRAAVPAKALRLLCEVGMAPLAMLQVAGAAERGRGPTKLPRKRRCSARLDRPKTLYR